MGSKRRRTKAEMEELRRLEEQKEADEAAQREELERLRKELEEARQRLEVTEHSDSVVLAMVDAGIISKKKDGNYELDQRLSKAAIESQDE